MLNSFIFKIVKNNLIDIFLMMMHKVIIALSSILYIRVYIVNDALEVYLHSSSSSYTKYSTTCTQLILPLTIIKI